MLLSTAVLAGVASLALPHLGWTAVAWLLPSLALTLSALALATVMPPLWAAGTVAFLWVAAVIASALRLRRCWRVGKRKLGSWRGARRRP